MRQNWDKEHLLKLTLAVYKIIALFPKGEDLGLKIRESADKILADLLLDKCEERCSSRIGEIIELFNIAEKKNLVDPRNFLVLRREYGLLKPDFNKPENKDVNRHDKILAVMSGNGTVKIGDLVKLFPGINRRTVLRDLDGLCQTGVMVRNGNGRGAYYVKNGHDKCDIPQQMSQ